MKIWRNYNIVCFREITVTAVSLSRSHIFDELIFQNHSAMMSSLHLALTLDIPLWCFWFLSIWIGILNRNPSKFKYSSSTSLWVILFLFRGSKIGLIVYVRTYAYVVHFQFWVSFRGNKIWANELCCNLWSYLTPSGASWTCRR